MSLTHPSDPHTATEQARFNMIEQQIRPWDVHNEAVLDALRAFRREDFIPAAYQGLAYSDIQIPLADGGFMLEPKLAGRMVQALDIHPDERVLQIGAGSGYTAALLSRLARAVQVVEQNPERIERVQQNLAMVGITNVQVEAGDATSGWPQAGEVDAILLRGGVAKVNESLFNQLASGGRLVAVVGKGAPMELVQYRRSAEGVVANSIIDTVVPGVLPRGDDEGKEFVF